LTQSNAITTMRGKPKGENMKNHTLVISAAVMVAFVLLASASSAQKGSAMSKAQAIAQQLSLTPQQKEKLLPILAAEVPKVQSIKNDNSLSKVQKIQQLKAIHRQNDPQMKAVLSPEQYQKLQAIRQETIRDAIQTRFGG
jgi:cell division protein FtsN